MHSNCSSCNSAFDITQDDLAFLEKISPTFAGIKHQIPPPTHCPPCRQRRRMAFRNERHLFRRPCDLCQKAFLAIYPADAPFPVYCYDCWWSDTWDPLTYGRPYDELQSFFEQFQSLAGVTPHLGIVFSHCENCDYTNFINYSKNSYLMFGCHATDHCLYGWRVHSSDRCVDCLQIDRSTLCYECIDCDECYEMRYAQDCTSCSNSAFLFDCRSCKHCFGCAGLRTKEHYLFNTPSTTDEVDVWFRKIETAEGLAEAEEKFRAVKASVPRRATFTQQSENVRGDHIIHGKNLRSCFYVKNAEDSAYLDSCEDVKDVVDCTFTGWPAELCYECLSAGVQCYGNTFSVTCWSCQRVHYSDSCHHSTDLFGCYGLHAKNRFCILNTQYSLEEYEEQVSSILFLMKKRGEYGEFFPARMSPFPYNDTVGQELLPLDEETALAQGFRWEIRHNENHAEAASETAKVCQTCRKQFRLIAQEKDFYTLLHIPEPTECFDCRHTRRTRLRGPRELWIRNCDSCGKKTESTYSPTFHGTVFCETCYQKDLY